MSPIRLKPAGLLLFVSVLVCAFAYSEENRFSLARTDYMLQCQGCHKEDGSGIEEAVPDLRTYGRYLLSTEDGRRYYVSVPGSAFAPLSDERLADVLNYIIAAIIEADDIVATPITSFTAEEVSTYRRGTVADIGQLRKELLRGAGGDSENEY